MSLDQYNSLMSSILNQQYTLTKLRAELEKRNGRKYWSCKKFRHLVYNCRNKNEKKKRKPIPRNKFKVLSSRVMKCGIREKVKIRRNKIVKEVECFRYWSVGYFKQKYPNIEVEKKEKRDEKAVYMASPQKAQQEKRLVHSLWRKAQEYSGIWRMPLKSTALEQKGQITRQEVVIFVEYGGCNYKNTKIHENQRQEFISGEYLRNVQCSSCLEVWR